MGEPIPANDLGLAELLRDDPNWIELQRSQRVCDFFNANAIFFGHGEMMPGGWPLLIGKNGAIEQYSMRSGHIAGAMGAFSYLYSELDFPSISIGRYCSIGSGLVLFGERHPMEWVTTSNITYCSSPLFMRVHRDLIANGGSPLVPPPMGAFPTIGHDVWIGQNASIARDVTIGTGAVVGLGSIVTRSVEPYMIVGGNPARPIRRRFSDALCERLLASRWWETHPDALFALERDDPASFLDQLEEARAISRIEPAPVRAFGWTDILAEIALMPA